MRARRRARHLAPAGLARPRPPPFARKLRPNEPAGARSGIGRGEPSALASGAGDKKGDGLGAGAGRRRRLSDRGRDERRRATARADVLQSGGEVPCPLRSSGASVGGDRGEPLSDGSGSPGGGERPEGRVDVSRGSEVLAGFREATASRSAASSSRRARRLATAAADFRASGRRKRRPKAGRLSPRDRARQGGAGEKQGLALRNLAKRPARPRPEGARGGSNGTSRRESPPQAVPRRAALLTIHGAKAPHLSGGNMSDNVALSAAYNI